VVVRRQRLAAACLILVILVVTGVWVAGARAGSRTSQAATPAGSPRSQASAVDTALNGKLGDESPAFCRIENKNLLLPIAASQATIIAYHSLDDELIVPLTPLGKRTDGNLVARGINRILSDEASLTYHVLSCQGRTAAQTGAVDVGAPAGATVVSPVSGEVTGVKYYRLYGKYDDVQIDIRPKGASDVLVSLLLVSDPRVSIGDSVEAGKTVLGTVRSPIQELAKRLAPITGEDGAHVHLQVTQSPSPIE